MVTNEDPAPLDDAAPRREHPHRVRLAPRSAEELLAAELGSPRALGAEEVHVHAHVAGGAGVHRLPSAPGAREPDLVRAPAAREPSADPRVPPSRSDEERADVPGGLAGPRPREAP